MFLIFMGVYFISLGVITIVKNIINIKKISKVVSVVVDAIIIDYEKKEYSSDSDNFCNNQVYFPVYEYYYNGTKYISKGTSALSVKNKLNEKIKIAINVDNPAEVVEGKKTNNVISICYGVIFIIIGAFTILLKCFENN